MVRVVDPQLIPNNLSFGKIIVKVNKICYVEKMDSKLYKSNLNLGTVNIRSKDDNGADIFIPKEEVYSLESLYRCIIDTGIVLDDTLEVDFSVESHPRLVTVLGLMALSLVTIVEPDSKRIGISIVNISSVKIDITKYMEFAVLVMRSKNFFNLPFTHE